jgi:hypothetical protein
MGQAGYNKSKSETVVATPQDFREAVKRRWNQPCVDLACTKENQFGEEGITEDEDSLSLDWRTRMCWLNWLNPPFDKIGPWVDKAADECLKGRTLVLVPASIGTKWFQRVQSRCDVLPLGPKRIKFDGHEHGYPKDLMLLIFPGTGKLLPQWDWTK